MNQHQHVRRSELHLPCMQPARLMQAPSPNLAPATNRLGQGTGLAGCCAHRYCESTLTKRCEGWWLSKMASSPCRVAGDSSRSSMRTGERCAGRATQGWGTPPVHRCSAAVTKHWQQALLRMGLAEGAQPKRRSEEHANQPTLNAVDGSLVCK